MRPSGGGRRLRPTTGRVRSALFSMLGPDGAAGRRVLDLYAGTGALGLEALRRGAAVAEFVEIDARRCEAIRKALAEAGMEERSRVRKGDATVVTRRLTGTYDLVFIDPPYADNPFESVLTALHGSEVLADDAVVFAEHSSRLQLPDTMAGVTLASRRKYGDSAVSVYRKDVDSHVADREARAGDW